MASHQLATVTTTCLSHVHDLPSFWKLLSLHLFHKRIGYSSKKPLTLSQDSTAKMGAWKIKSEQRAATMRNKEDRQSLLHVFWAVRGCGTREREEPGRPELRSRALPLSARLGWVALPVPLGAIYLSLQEALEPWVHCAWHTTALRRLGSSRRNVGPLVEKSGSQSQLHSVAALHLGR